MYCSLGEFTFLTHRARELRDLVITLAEKLNPQTLRKLAGTKKKNVKLTILATLAYAGERHVCD